MPTPMIPCSSCSRHVRVSDAACPFCKAQLPADAAARAVPGPSGRMPRAAMAVFAATLTVAACGDGDGPDTGQTTPVYGAPAQGGQAGGAGSAGSSGTGGSAGTGGGASGQGGAGGTAGSTLGGGGVGGDMSGPGAGGAGPVYGAPATGGAAGDTSGGSGGAVPIYGAAPQ